MSTSIRSGVGSSDTLGNHTRNTTERRRTETKSAFKTTEFMAYVAVLAGILIAGLLVDSGSDGNGGFGSQKVWLYATILTVGYMVSRGLAKAGSQDPYTHTNDNG